MNVTPRLAKAILNNAVATGGALDPADTFLGLYISGPTVDPPIDTGDFTLPDATDAPAKLVNAFTTPVLLDDGRWCVQGDALTWRLPDADNAFVAAGWYVADALTGGNILAYQPFNSPISLPNADRSITIVFRPAIDPADSWEASVVIDG